MLLYVSPNISPPLASVISSPVNTILFVINDVLKLNIKPVFANRILINTAIIACYKTHFLFRLSLLGYKTLESYSGQSEHAKIASIASH